MNNFARIMVPLSKEEFIALQAIAEREYREPRQQARLIIRSVLFGGSLSDRDQRPVKVVQVPSVGAGAGNLSVAQ